MKCNTFLTFRLSVPVLASLILSACGGTAQNGNPSTSSSFSSAASSNPVVSSSAAVSSSLASSSSLPSSSSSSSSSVSPVNPPLILAINSGSTTAAVFNGVEYEADKYANGGSTNRTEDAINDANGSSVMQTERYGNYSYEIPVYDGTYTVEMHFVEMYHTDSGMRSFDVAVESEQVESNLDLFATTGHDTLMTIAVRDISVTDGVLNIRLSPNTDAGTITGFAVYSSDGGIDTSVPVSNCTGYVALTFDDGPTSNTRAFIQRLKDNDLQPVTFFVWANRINDASVIRDMMEVGEIQNHSFTHPQGMGNMGYQQVYDELSRANNAITGAGAPLPTIFRVPYLEYGNGIQQAANDLGLYVIRNQIDTQDWNNASSQQIINTVAGAGSGDVILAHENQGNTISASTVQGMANALKQKGLCPGLIDPNTGRAVAP